MISFIIPVYNAQNTIKKCVDSILAIEYENIEVIVVDDGSTDKTAEILKSFDTDRIIVIYQERSFSGQKSWYKQRKREVYIFCGCG